MSDDQDPKAVMDAALAKALRELAKAGKKSPISIVVPGTEGTPADAPPSGEASAEGAEGVPAFNTFDEKVQDDVRTAVSDYVADKIGAAPGDELNVDAAFLRQHGPAMMATVVEAFTRALVPKEIEVDVPAPAGIDAANAPPIDGEPAPKPAPGSTKIKIDVNALITNLFASLTRPRAPEVPKRQPEPSDDRGDE